MFFAYLSNARKAVYLYTGLAGLCLGIVTFEQGAASLTGSYSMAVRPIEEHPCVLRGKGTQKKYATKLLRALLHAKAITCYTIL